MKNKRPDPMIEALQQGIPYTIQMADGGNFASMRAAVKHGQILTFSPVKEAAALQIGDIVMVNWRSGTPIMHLIGDIRDGQFLIINSLGKENGWVTVDAIFGYVIKTIEPERHLSVSAMLDRLELAYHQCIERTKSPEDAGARLLSIVADLRWYSKQISSAHWQQLPRLNLWSFEQHLWHLMKGAQEAAAHGTVETVHRLLNDGKEHVGAVAAISALWDVKANAFVINKDNTRASVTIRNFNMALDFVPLLNLRNLCVGPDAQPVTIDQQREDLKAPNQEPALDRWVAEEIGNPWTLLGQSFGYHTIPERYLAWMEVHPRWRRLGLGVQLLQRVIERAKAVGAEHLLINVREGEQYQAGHAFLQRQGFSAKSDVWLMHASAEQAVATVQLPTGYKIRRYSEVQDLDILWQVCYQSYGDQWGHGENSRINRAKPPETTVIAWLTDVAPNGENIFLLFDQKDCVAGICRGFTGKQTGDALSTGIIDAPGVVPAYRHLALQRPLLLTVMQWLRAQRQGAIELSSLGDTLDTIALYEEMGFVIKQHWVAYHLDII